MHSRSRQTIDKHTMVIGNMMAIKKWKIMRQFVIFMKIKFGRYKHPSSLWGGEWGLGTILSE